MMPAANTMPAVGEVIGEGRFELLGKLGEGGMSLVFLARDLELGRQVALKLLLPRYVGRPEREQRLINEAEYLRRLKGHPNIIEFVAEGRLHDRGDWPWLATEVLQGTVLDWLFVQRKLQPDEVLHVARQVAEALRACHAAGIVHRDPTPGNVFLLDDDAQTIKLFDFSHSGDLAGPKVAAGEHGRLTGIHDVPGTLGYMGPEQVTTAPADAKMDVFGFGVLLFEIVTRRNPYQHITEREAFIAAQRAGTLEAPKLHAWAYGVPDALAELVHDCTAREAELRPSMVEVLRRLGELELGGETAKPSAVVPDATERFTLPFVVPQIVEHTQPVGPPPGMQREEPRVVNDWTKLPIDRTPRVVAVEPAAPPPEEPTDQTGVELAFARPAQLRSPAPELEFHEPLPEPEDSANDPDEQPTTPQRSRWLIPVLVVIAVVVGVALLWMQLSPTDDPGETSSASAPPFEPEPTPEPETHPEVGPQAPSEPASDATSSSTGEDEEGETSTSEGAVEPEPAPRKRQPELAPAPDCEGVERDGRAAAQARDWKTLAKLTTRSKCWSSKRERTLLRVKATFFLGQWSDCVNAGRSSSDPEVRALVDNCKDNLGTP